jgi:hypothetical protein
MTRPKFTHEKAGGTKGGPEWAKTEDKQLVVKKSVDDEVPDERWNFYLERAEDGRMWPALPPSACDEKNEIREEKRPKTDEDGV